MLGGVEIACVAFLDDYMTPTRDARVINKVLEVLRDYGARWDVQWAVTKFRVLRFNGAKSDISWVFDGTPVQTTERHKYLGVTHSTNKPYWTDHYSEKLGVAYFLIVRLRAVGLIGGRNTPAAALEIIRSMVWQMLDYGRATAPSSARGHAQIRKKLEGLQMKVLREILGLSSSSPKLAVHGEYGDLPDIWRERRKQLQIANQMMTSDSTSLPYRVAKEANEASPKVGLLHEVGVILTTLGEPGRTVESFRNKDEVNKWVSRAATAEWRRGVSQSTRLCDTYQVATHLRLRGYLRADFKGRQILTKLRADDLALGAASWRGRGGTTVDSCQTCRQLNCVETRTHFVLHCSALAKTRRAYPEILAWIQNSRAERAFAMILLALPERAADDIERATVVGAYLQDLWSERAAILGLNSVQL